MSDAMTNGSRRSVDHLAPASDYADRAQPVALGYAVSLVMVAAVTLLALIVDHLIAAPNLSLLFVLPVMVAAAAFGWGPGLAAAVAGALAFDFFFIEPRYSLSIASPRDLWAMSLLFLIATFVSTVSAQARRRALEAREAADRAQALRILAHAVIQQAPPGEVARAAAETLARVFKAPAAVFLETGGRLARAATAGGAELTDDDDEAARLALEGNVATRGGVYPVERAEFDFWPIPACRAVLGAKLEDPDKDRPSDPDRLVEIIGAYLTAALARPGG